MRKEDHPAEKRGADELMNRCEYTLRPRALKNARKAYRDACLKLYGFLRRHFRRRP
ncbi:MAG: hypothetical protein WA857_21870 [Candidatus Acidiferrum sp.]